jgi:guanylate kinase
MGKSSSGKDSLFEGLIQNKELGLKTIVGYTTRPMRHNEEQGREYFFVSEEKMHELEDNGKVIECRGYNTLHGMWYYFTVDDGKIEDDKNYLYIGTLESYEKMKKYYGSDCVIPIYVEVENGERLERALVRERKQQEPKYAEMCRRFLADEEDFSEEKIKASGIKKRYENIDFEKCLGEIAADIKESQKQRRFY